MSNLRYMRYDEQRQELVVQMDWGGAAALFPGGADDVPARLRELAARLERNACYHDDTQRLGAIWTRCNQCGKKWADGEGKP